MNRTSKVRKIYEQEYFKFQEKNHWERIITDFQSKYKIASGGYCPDWYDWESFSEDELLFFETQANEKKSPCDLSISINRKMKVPNSLSNACDRIYWYLKHSFGEMTVIKITVDNIDTFAICITGYIDDGWDNSCELIEIWDSSGDLIGSAYPPTMDDPDPKIWNWKDRPIRGDDFNSPAPEW
ncbi:MAG: hypothetical protein Tsb0014_44890 [Pleurocapsa sp.]